ncbi:MAG: nucleotidyltransferase domain-containing protein [Phycisphaerae bacterium]|nr:nucleotidyltransferase domain-containing protein [Phycisphaerae bacterium]
MVGREIIEIVRRYLAALPGVGIHAERAVLFGSHARGDWDEYSDIDLVVIAPEFDKPRTLEQIGQLWQATASADNRIEPIPCGLREWQREQGRPILDIARNEGVIVSVDIPRQ